MQDITINDTYDRITRIMKNDQQYHYKRVGELIVTHVHAMQDTESYYANYPPLLDIAELAGALAYEGSVYQDEIVRQVHYKLQELRQLLPEIK